MRITVPITGEILNGKSGNPANPVRPVNFHKLLPPGLDNFGWQAIEWDFENGTVEIEVTFRHDTFATLDGEGKLLSSRRETDTELNQRRTASENALRDMLKKTKEELYALSGDKPLKKPFESD